MSQAPFALAIDGGGDHFPVAGSAPRLSWKVPGARTDWTGSELEYSVNGGSALQAPVAGAVHRFVRWPAEPLPSAARVSWRVRSTTLGGVSSEWSEPASFEVGLLDQDWTADWITPDEPTDAGYGNRPATRLSTHFDISGEVVRARLYSTALGVYEAFINAERAGTAELSPGATSYDKTLYAQAADVTSSVRAGGNTLEIELSDGWYRGQVGAHRMPAGWGTTLGFRAELHLDLAGGERMVVRTGEGWATTKSTIVRADLMAGQTVDLRVTPGDERPVRVGLVQAPPIDWSPAPPVRVIETRRPVSVERISDDVWVADFGQNASGWIALTDLGPSGTRTVIDFGEFRGANGDLSTTHLDSHRPGEPNVPFVQRDEVVASGTPGERFEPRHTVHGFQYARLRRTGAPIDPASVSMRIVQSDLQRTGTFLCSDADLNRLHEIADWSFRGNAVDVPTDCPTRERIAWTGDYQVFAPTATRLYDVLGFSRKWLRSVRDDQLDDGRIANFSPDGRRIKLNLDDQFAQMTGSAGWGDAVVAVPWELYESYGDTLVLEENWAAMVRWVDWALENARTARHHSRVQASPDPKPHERFLWDGSFHWGEWTEPKEKRADGTPIDPVVDNPVAWFMADKGEVGTAYLYRSTSTLATIAAVLGFAAQAEHYARTAQQVLSAWRTEFLLASGRTAGDTQASYVRALDFGLIPDDQTEGAAARLVELIRAAGNHLSTGFLSTGQLLPVLVDHGHTDVAYDLLFQRTSPSWLAMVDRGATTIWEEWEGIDAAGHAHESLNHYSKGAVIRFLHTHTLGLRQSPGSVAWESFVVQPVPPASLSWARGTHSGPNGDIAVEWHADGGDLQLTVDVPMGSTATIIFPDGTTLNRGPGRHTATRTTPQGDA